MRINVGGVLLRIISLGVIVGLIPMPAVFAAQEAGEVWVTGQDAARIHIVQGTRSVESIRLPYGSSPHFARFSPSGKYVYVPGLGYGTVVVIRTADRMIVRIISVAPATPPAVNSNPLLPGGLGTHDAKPSPDGSLVLATQWSNNTLYKISANEQEERWAIVQSTALNSRPICVVFHPRGNRAYVGTAPSGIAVIDVARLTVAKTLATTGAWSCSWAQTRDGTRMFLTTNAAPGFLYRLNMTQDTIEDLGLPLNSGHIHGLGLSPDEKVLYLTSREDDSLRIVSLGTSSGVQTMSLDITPGVPDRPDSVAVQGDTVWITLRSSGKLVRFRPGAKNVEAISLEPACPPAENLCYAIHSVDFRY